MDYEEFAQRIERLLYAVSSYIEPDMRIGQEEEKKEDKDGDKNE